MKDTLSFLKNLCLSISGSIILSWLFVAVASFVQKTACEFTSKNIQFPFAAFVPCYGSFEMRLFFSAVLIIWFIFWFNSLYFTGSRKRKSVTMDRHAPGSVGVTTGDALDLGKKASQFGEHLLFEEVSSFKVIALTGDMGEGKSSFLRMAIESIRTENKGNFLYSYVSLTESNNEKDLAKLLEDRLFETISSRYHFSVVIRYFFKQGLSGVLNLEGLRLFERICSYFVGGNDALYFGVKSFEESHWVICFDEVERGHLNELILLTEVIERYKYQAINDFRIKFTIVVCYSDEVLRLRLPGSTYKNREQVDALELDKKQVLHDYFFTYKTAQSVIRLPLQSLESKFKVIKDLFINLATSYDWDVSEDIKKGEYISPKQYHLILNKKQSFISPEDTANIAMGLLSSYPMREIISLVNEAENELRKIAPLGKFIYMKDIISLVLIRKENLKEYKRFVKNATDPNLPTITMQNDVEATGDEFRFLVKSSVPNIGSEANPWYQFSTINIDNLRLLI